MSKNNLKVLILVGLPASGKSVFSKKFVEENPNYIRVCRDDFRFMLKNTGLSIPKIEELINETMDVLIIKALCDRFNIIIDNTNLKLSYINHFIEMVRDYADIEFKVFDVNMEECLLRDKNRQNSVGEAVIKRMAENFETLKQNFKFESIKKNFKPRQLKRREYNSSLIDAVVFDMDGTLSLLGDRNIFDWSKVDVDDINIIVAEHINYHKYMGRQIIILSGREDKAKELTEKWLKENGIKHDYLFMRKANDNRKDSVIKTEIFNDELKDKFNIMCVYDDRLSVVKMWYKLGIFCFCVNQGLKEF